MNFINLRNNYIQEPYFYNKSLFMYPLLLTAAFLIQLNFSDNKPKLKHYINCTCSVQRPPKMCINDPHPPIPHMLTLSYIKELCIRLRPTQKKLNKIGVEWPLRPFKEGSPAPVLVCLQLKYNMMQYFAVICHLSTS